MYLGRLGQGRSCGCMSSLDGSTEHANMVGLPFSSLLGGQGLGRKGLGL